MGERYFDACDFQSAASTYEKYLKKPDQQNYAAALFRFGMARFLAGGPPKELRKAEDAFKTVVEHFPDSPYRHEAEFILNQMAQIDRLENDLKKRKEEIDQLKDELQRLKDIDMQRKPSRPP